MGCYYHIRPCQEYRPSLTEEKIQQVFENGDIDELGKQYIQAKGYDVIEMYKCDWWKFYKADNFVKQHLRESFPYKMALSEERLSENIKSGRLFVYVQCDFEVAQNIRETFTKFPPVFKKITVSRVESGPFMKRYAEKEEILTQPRRMLVSSYFLEKGTIIPPLLFFYLDLGLVCS